MISREVRGTPRKYIQKTSSDAAAGGLTETERQDSNGNEPIGALVTADTNPARIRVDGGSPSQTEGHRLSDGDFLWLTCLTEVKNLDWASHTSTSASEIHITLYY